MTLTIVPDRPIAFNRDFVHLGIGITGALFLSQCIYWNRRVKNNTGWFYKTAEEFEEETGMSRKEQATARRRLVALGILEEERRGLPARLYFRVWENKIAGLYKTCLPERVKPVFPNGENSMPPMGKSYKDQTKLPTESTTENTTESTTEKDICAHGRNLGADFERFWKAYPKKKSKKDAEKAFKAAKKIPPIDELCAILETHKASNDWIKERGKYIPHAATWLRSERWNDEVDGVMTAEDRERFGFNSDGPNYFQQLAQKDSDDE